MKNKKLQLNELKVQSFITSLENAEKQTLKDMNGGLNAGSFACAESMDDVCTPNHVPQLPASNQAPLGCTIQPGGGFCVCPIGGGAREC